MKLPNNNFTIFILLLYPIIILGSFENNQAFERYTFDHALKELKVKNRSKPLMEQVKSEISLQNERAMKKLQEKITKAGNKSQKHETIGHIFQALKDAELKSDKLDRGKIHDLEPPRMATSCRPLKSDRGDKIKPIITKDKSLYYHEGETLKQPNSTGSYLRTHGPLKSDFVGGSQLHRREKIKPIITKDLYYHKEDLKQPNSTSSYFRTYGHPNSDLVDESQLLLGERIKPINTKDRSRHTDLMEPQSTGTLKSHFDKESKTEAKVNPIIMKESSHDYAANELKQPHTASSFFRTQRSQTKLHFDYDRLYNNTGDPQVEPRLNSIRTKPKENDKNYSHKVEGGQAKTPSTSSLLRKFTASWASGNTKVEPSHRQSNTKHERHQSNVSDKSSTSSSYNTMSGSEKYSTLTSRSSLLHHFHGESLYPAKNDTEQDEFDFNLGDNLSKLSRLRLKPNKNEEEEKLTQGEKTSNPKSPFSRILSSITPRILTPKILTPRSLTPTNLTPRSLTPTNLTPRSLTPNFSSTKIYEKIKSYERGKSSTRVVLSSEVIHLDCLNPRKLKKDKMDSNLTLINFKSYFAKRDPFTDEYKEVESSVLVFLNEMIGKGGVAEVYRGIFCDGRKEIKVAVKLFGFHTTRINSKDLKDLFADPKNEMGVFEGFEKFYNKKYSEHSGIVKMFNGEGLLGAKTDNSYSNEDNIKLVIIRVFYSGAIQNIEYSANEENKHDFKYVIITELGGDNFLKYIGGKIREGKLSESELMNELVKPATCLIKFHEVAIHMDFKPQNLYFANYTEDYATTKTDIWEFGILIFQIILLNDNHLSLLEFDKWINDVSTIGKINTFFTYLFFAQDKIVDDPKRFEKTITLLLNSLHGSAVRRLSAKGIRDNLTSECRIGKKSKTFQIFLETKFIDENGKEFGIMTEEHKILLRAGKEKLLILENNEEIAMRECDRN
uniref:Protein kinase domain-containing protein n=1 Tax=Meloidogyne javanica TaxID=6303 RepID=A0A915LNN7_MELJA